MSRKESLYVILGVAESATESEIKKAYRKLVRMLLVSMQTKQNKTNLYRCMRQSSAHFVWVVSSLTI
jgi:preprotein translocase subunit Sec63